MIKSGLNIIEGNKSRENFYKENNQKGMNYLFNNEKNLPNSNKKMNQNKETELYLDEVIKKTDIITHNLKNDSGQNDDQRMKEILKVLENDKNNKYNNSDSKNKFTPNKIKNNIYKNKEPDYQDINLGAINFRSKYENYENNNIDYSQKDKSKYTSNIKNSQETQLKESMKGVSEFIQSSQKKVENISGINLFNNPNKNTGRVMNERKIDKKYILKDDFLQNQIKINNKKKESGKKDDKNEVKESLNSNMKITFGEGTNLKFVIENDNNNYYNNKNNESLRAFNDKNTQEKSQKEYTFKNKFESEKNKDKENNEIKEKDDIDDDEEDEEKYDIKVNSENDINYDNMLKSTKKSDLKFLDFDQFCDIENDDEENKKTKKKGKKKKKSIRHPNNKINEETNEDDLCNIIISDKEDNNYNEDKNSKINKEDNNSNINKMTESKKIQNQLNFFSDSITKGISHKRNDKSIFRRNNGNNDDDNINLLSKESFDKIKEKKENNDKVGENDINNNNILEESEDLKDSYCDNILKNINKFRGDFNKD